METISVSNTATTTHAWNGPTCPTCHRGYIGAHQCQVADLWIEVRRLMQRITELSAPQPTVTYAEQCPCNPARGGSGVCGCILGGTRITC